jgi:hypothetical protein
MMDMVMLDIPKIFSYKIGIDNINGENYANHYFEQVSGGHTKTCSRETEAEASAETDSHRKRRYAYFDPANPS